VDPKEKENLQRLRAAAELVEVIPLNIMASLLRVPEDELRNMDASVFVDVVVKAVSNNSKAATIDKARTTFLRLVLFCDFYDIEVEAIRRGAAAPLTLALFLMAVDRGARIKAGAASPEEGQQVCPLIDRAQKRRKGDGSSAAEGARGALKWLLRLDFQLDLDNIVVANAVSGREQKMAQAAPPLSIRAVLELERLALAEGEPLAARQLAAQWLALIFSGSRFRQAQCTDIHGTTDDAAFGVCAQAKSSKVRPCMVYVPLMGLLGKEWWEIWMSAYRRQGFMILDVEGGSGDPFSPRAKGLAGWGPNDRRAVIGLRALLRWGGMSGEEAARFTLHSARHTLIHIATMRGEPDSARADIGAWFGSSLQGNDMVPPTRRAADRTQGISDMPDRYSQGPAARRVCAVYMRQVAAMRATVARHGRDALPHVDGWELLVK